MPLVEVAGDLFTSGEPALAHGCNCAGAMGRGIAVEFRRRWPEMYDEYRRRCLAGSFQPGDVFDWRADEVVVFNLGTQRTWRTRATPEAISTSVQRMVVRAFELDLCRVGLPRIGAGLGGLDWAAVRSLLESAAGDDVTLAIYTPPGRE